METIYRFLYFILFSLCFLFPDISFGGINLPWSTTFNCPDWIHNIGGPPELNCDGLSRALDATCQGNTNKTEEISAIADYPGGGGGKGQIHYLGYGTNNHSGGLVVYFNTPQSELWVRYYIKYAPGFTWSWLNYQKQIYINVTRPNAFVIEPKDWDYFIMSTGIENFFSPLGYGWNSKFRNNNWHCVEFHSKLHTTTFTPYDGIIQLWIDGIKILDRSDINYQGTPSQLWENILFGSNGAEITSSGCLGVYYDDIAISNTGRIGCLNALIDDPPSPPVGLKIGQ